MHSEDPAPDVDLTFATYLRDPWKSNADMLNREVKQGSSAV